MLAQPASDPHDRAVRWRQLVELTARAGDHADRELLAQAIASLRSDANAIDERVRTAAALAVAPLQLPVGLVAAFAADRIAVAAPVLASARLTASEWAEVAQSASDECRAFVAAMRGEPGRDDGSKIIETPQRPGVPSIGEVVARIEKIRQSREADSSTEPAPEKVVSEPSRLFRWECNEAGEIDWVEGAPRGALVGQSIALAGLEGGVDETVERAFARRAPFHDGTLVLSRGGSTAGTWTISGVPAFEQSSGRFAGYRGLAERAGGSEADGQQGGGADANSLRELAHEIKTPLNAIIGFAEIISGEFLGPADSRYRERAGEIVAQARLLLAAVEDIDFAARLKSGHDSATSELSDALAGAWDRIEARAEERGVLLAIEPADEPARCGLGPQLAQRLVERFCIAVIDCGRDGEKLTFRLGGDGQGCVLSVNRPESLSGTELRPERNRRAGDVATLPLRLVLGLARTAGGELDDSGNRLTLHLPRP